MKAIGRIVVIATVLAGGSGFMAAVTASAGAATAASALGVVAWENPRFGSPQTMTLIGTFTVGGASYRGSVSGSAAAGCDRDNSCFGEADNLDASNRANFSAPNCDLSFNFNPNSLLVQSVTIGMFCYSVEIDGQTSSNVTFTLDTVWVSAGLGVLPVPDLVLGVFTA